MTRRAAEELIQATALVICAQQRSPQDLDLAEARFLLSRQLPDTVSLRAAARLLGMSHTALARWIKAGDLPTVSDRNGRTRLTTLAVLDLHDRVSSEPRAGQPISATMRKARARAEGLDPAGLLGERPAPRNNHERAAARSLAYHRAVADRLDESMVLGARQILRTWEMEGRIDEDYACAWKHLLGLPLTTMAEELRRDDQAAQDMRQNSPFAAALSEPERRKILTTVR